GVVGIARTARKVDAHRHAQLLRQQDGLAADLLIVFGNLLVGMQRVAVTAQRTDGEAVVGKLLLEVEQLRYFVQHRELAVRVAGIIARAQFDRIDIDALQFLQNVVERHLRQQGGKYTDSHVILLGKDRWIPKTE